MLAKVALLLLVFFAVIAMVGRWLAGRGDPRCPRCGAARAGGRPCRCGAG